MNYLKIYNQIIDRRKIIQPTGYKEKHHIIPRCLGGTDNKNNLVSLTAREHFICHLLLTKIYKNDNYNYYKLLNAFLFMKCNSLKQKRYFNSRLYEYLRQDFSKLMSNLNSGIKNGNFKCIWLNNKNLQISKLVKQENIQEYLINGWEIGRIINWESYKKQELYKLIQIFNNRIKQYNNRIRQYNKSIKKDFKKHKLKDRTDKNRELYNFYYQEYNKLGWVYFKEKYNYTKTQQNFVSQLKRYVKDFKPQNSKKRGDKNLRYNPYKDK